VYADVHYILQIRLAVPLAVCGSLVASDSSFAIVSTDSLLIFVTQRGKVAKSGPPAYGLLSVEHCGSRQHERGRKRFNVLEEVLLVPGV